MTSTHELRSAAEIDPAFLTGVLHDAGVGAGARVVAMATKPIGTGQMGSSFRFELTWSTENPRLPRSIVGKFPSDDERSRAAGAAGAYARELGFYADLQPKLQVPTPTPFAAVFDAEACDFMLLMSDVRPARQGDQLAGCDVELAEAAAETIATLHAPTWGRTDDVVALGWIPAPSAEGLGEHVARYRLLFDGFARSFADRMRAEDIAMGEWIGDHLVELALGHTLPRCIVHNDFRLDNILIGEGDGAAPLTIVDWQTMSVGVGPADVAYFVGTGLADEPSREEEEALVELYRLRLSALGVDAAFDDVWRSYCLGSTSGLAMAVIASQLVVRTERGDDMFTAMAVRSAAQMRRLGLLELLG